MAERKMGEMLAQTPRAKGTAGTGRPKKGGHVALPPKSDTPTLATLGISKRERKMGQMLAVTKPKRAKGGGKGAGGSILEPPATPTLADLGIDKRERKMGQMLAQTKPKRAKGGRPKKIGSKTEPIMPPTLAELGVTPFAKVR